MTRPDGPPAPVPYRDSERVRLPRAIAARLARTGWISTAAPAGPATPSVPAEARPAGRADGEEPKG